MKSTVEEIRQRFDAEVERFSNLQTGQTAATDAPLALELIAQAAAAVTPNARRVLDVGCGAGNYTLKLIEYRAVEEITLVDLSRVMLDRAQQRIRHVHRGSIRALQVDIRETELGEQTFDVILASAVLHHLRTDDQWRDTFGKFHRALTPGGSLWVFDLIDYELPQVRELMRERYSAYLESVDGPAYREEILNYIDREDTPKPLTWQLDLLREVGFRQVEVLHASTCFAAFGAVKS